MTWCDIIAYTKGLIDEKRRRNDDGEPAGGVGTSKEVSKRIGKRGIHLYPRY